MAVSLSALPTYGRESEFSGSGLMLAGQGLGRGTMKKIGRGLKKASKVAEAAAPIIALTNPELAPAIGTAMAVKGVLDGSGLQLAGSGMGKGTQKKIARGLRKGAVIGEKLVNEFGTDKQKRQAAKARKVANIVGAGHGKPGHALRKRVMEHAYAAA